MDYPRQNLFLVGRYLAIITLNNVSMSLVFGMMIAAMSNVFYGFLNMWFSLGLATAFFIYHQLQSHEYLMYANRQLSMRWLVALACGFNGLFGVILWLIFWRTGALQGHFNPHFLHPRYLLEWWNYGYHQMWPHIYPYRGWLWGGLALGLLMGGVIWGIRRLSKGTEAPFYELPHRLSIDSVVLHRGDKRILSGAWLNWQTGEVVGLLGLNGCGKSTLMKILWGVWKGDSATLYLDEEYTQKLYLKRHHLAYLPQDSFLPYRWRVRQAIQYLVPDPVQQQHLREEPRLKKLLKTRIHQLSGGERRYLEALLILNQQTAFVMMDEPFSELEPLYRTLMRELIEKAREYQGILVTDHDYHNILACSDRIVLLRGGQCFPIENEEQLQQVYIPL